MEDARNKKGTCKLTTKVDCATCKLTTANKRRRLFGGALRPLRFPKCFNKVALLSCYTQYSYIHSFCMNSYVVERKKAKKAKVRKKKKAKRGNNKKKAKLGGDSNERKKVQRRTKEAKIGFVGKKVSIIIIP